MSYGADSDVAEMQRRRGCGAARRAAMRSLGSGELRSGQRHVAEPRAVRCGCELRGGGYELRGR